MLILGASRAEKSDQGERQPTAQTDQIYLGVTPPLFTVACFPSEGDQGEPTGRNLTAC